MGEVVWHEFSSGARLAETLAETVAGRLAEAIEARGTALLAVSGGSTPAAFFRALSRKRIDWRHVIVSLVDERFVPPSSERSNARLVAHHLLQNEAARADFVGLYHEFDSVEEAAEKADRAVGTLPLPLDVAVLGMGTDGHTASFFPDARNLPLLLDGHGKRRILPVHAPSAREPRLTLAMPLLRQARFLALHIEGIEKKDVLKSALGDDGPARVPVRAVADQAVEPLHVFWAPASDVGKAQASA